MSGSFNLKIQNVNLKVQNVTKVYPGTTALDNVSIDFESGRVHALIGKNGAGKSTLVKILSGAVRANEGIILIDGRKVRIRSPRDAFRKGIATVYQEPNLVPGLSVSENIFVGRLPRKRTFTRFVVDWQEVFSQGQKLLDSLKIKLDVKRKIADLPLAQQKIVEIARAMSFEPSVLILDEPTASLAHHEAETLFSLIKNLKNRGVCIVYISHRLGELKKIADIVSVLRDGSLVGTISIDQAAPQTVAHMMFGEQVKKSYTAPLTVRPNTVLEVRNLCIKDKLHDVSFRLNEGEILGLAGVVGSGRTELLRAIFGAERFDSGQILVNGKRIKKPSPSRMKRLGIGMTPEDRSRQGLVGSMCVRDNISLSSLARISLGGLIWKERQRPVVEKTTADLNIAVANVEHSITSLSGGNRQKVVVGNWLNTHPKIMFFDEPTAGIDIQAKQQIFQIIRNLSDKGISSVFVSSELEELIEVCHRILIMRDGSLVNELVPDNLQLSELFELCVED